MTESAIEIEIVMVTGIAIGTAMKGMSGTRDETASESGSEIEDGITAHTTILTGKDSITKRKAIAAEASSEIAVKGKGTVTATMRKTDGTSGPTDQSGPTNHRSISIAMYLGSKCSEKT